MPSDSAAKKFNDTRSVTLPFYLCFSCCHSEWQTLLQYCSHKNSSDVGEIITNGSGHEQTCLKIHTHTIITFRINNKRQPIAIINTIVKTKWTIIKRFIHYENYKSTICFLLVNKRI